MKTGDYNNRFRIATSYKRLMSVCFREGCILEIELYVLGAQASSPANHQTSTIVKLKSAGENCLLFQQRALKTDGEEEMIRSPTFSLIFLLIALSVSGCLRRSASTSSQQATPSPSATLSSLPKPNGLVNDYANVFELSAKNRLGLTVEELRRDVDVEFGIATVDTTNGASIFDYSLALAREWKLGGGSGRGLLLVLAIKDRQWQLQVSETLRMDLPDAVCKELAEPSVKLYAQGKYAEGVDRYVRAIWDRLKAKR